jgi:hypothetical protein
MSVDNSRVLKRVLGAQNPQKLSKIIDQNPQVEGGGPKKYSSKI